MNINYVQKSWNPSLNSLHWVDAKNLTYYFKILTKNSSRSTVVFLNRSSFQANGALEFLWLLLQDATGKRIKQQKCRFLQLWRSKTRSPDVFDRMTYLEACIVLPAPVQGFFVVSAKSELASICLIFVWPSLLLRVWPHALPVISTCHGFEACPDRLTDLPYRTSVKGICTDIFSIRQLSVSRSEDRRMSSGTRSI